MRRIVLLALGAICATSILLGCPAPPPPGRAEASTSGGSAASPFLRFAVSFPESQSAAPLDGRVYLLLSNDESREPRLQISTGLKTQQIFGVDIDGLAPGKEAAIDSKTIGYPRGLGHASERPLSARHFSRALHARR